ncbi:MAG: M42 family metallopeptidase [Actinomycetota bacterium]|nr:M42 family metallopeptidase [Actinomycetota bacterium]
MTDTPKLLEDLLQVPAPSGYEAPASAVWRDAAAEFAEVRSDGIGSSIAVVGDDESQPLFAIAGHMDEIGLVVTHIDDKGFIWFGSIGGWDPQILVGQRVEIATKDGPIAGVAGRKPIHLLEEDQRKKVVELKQLHIDIGAEDGDAARELVRIGDPAVIRGEPMRVQGSRLVSRSMDNRLGSYVALEVARRCAASDKVTCRVAGVANAQEEIGLYGARTAAFHLEPTLAVAVDVTHATDAPGIDENQEGSHHLGTGPVISRGSTLSPVVFELLADVASKADIPHTFSGSGNRTGTDADAIQITRSGIPAGLVSIPLRYMHSPVEMVDLEDVEATVALLVAFAETLGPDLDLSR